MKDLLELYLTFFKIGAFTFGGGYSMMPMIQKEIVEKHKWATDEEVLNYYAVGQCTPGVIAVNTSTFIGYKRRGVLGGFVATAGMITPSLIIIMVIAAFLSNFAHLEFVKHAFAGIRVAVAALVIQAVVKMWKTGVKDAVGVSVFAAAFLVSLIFNVSPIYVVIGSVAVGIAISLLRARGEGNE